MKEMRQLYDRGVRGFWFTDAQFVGKATRDAKELLRAIKAEGLTGIRWAAHIRADNLTLNSPAVEMYEPFRDRHYIRLASSFARCAWATTFALFWRVAACWRMRASWITCRSTTPST